MKKGESTIGFFLAINSFWVDFSTYKRASPKILTLQRRCIIYQPHLKCIQTGGRKIRKLVKRGNDETKPIFILGSFDKARQRNTVEISEVKGYYEQESAARRVVFTQNY